jgi:ATP-dependent protease ClpP protease subunit
MPTKEIVIDGYIGSYAYSKQFIRNELKGNKKNDVLAKISSLGGDVDHALNIFDQFVEHGNVTAELSAFVASSATLISLGAKTVRMNENSFYLIHKVMNWVDEWGAMNEDEIDALINKLEKQKQELAKITLQIARMYVKKTGKKLEEIINLMKQETWLTAEEAKDWGFVDEIFAPAVAVNYLEDMKLVAMVSSNGFPEPPRKHTIKAPVINNIDEDTFFEKMWNRITNRQKENPNSNNSQNKKSMKQFTKLNAVLGVENLEAVENEVSFNEEYLQKVEDVLVANDQAVADARTKAEGERDTAIQEKTTAEENLQNAVSAFDAIDTTIAEAKTPEEKAEAVRTLLAKKPGAKPTANLDKADPKNDDNKEVDWETINNLPHNKEADNL